MFARLASAWTAPADAVPRLAILLSFERWVMFRDPALDALQPLTGRGVKVEVFYEQQAFGVHLRTWFAFGQFVHNVPAVIATLTTRWQPSAIWPMVIDTLARLVRAHVSAPALPALLVEVAGLALSCGGAEQAVTLAREALDHLPAGPSVIRGKALRELGAALMGQGRTVEGLELLDQAIAMTTDHDPAEDFAAVAIGVSALCQSALAALNHDDYASAERRFRRAIELMSVMHIKRRHLLAVAHHSLAVALMHQGSDEAGLHARTALALRSDPDSHLAKEDRALLATLSDARTGPN